MLYVHLSLGAIALLVLLFAARAAGRGDRKNAIRLIWIVAFIGISAGLLAVAYPTMFSANATVIQ